MADLVVPLVGSIEGADGLTYSARVSARQDEDGRWTGWLEFEPTGGGQKLRTPQETIQPDRDDLEYWATGLSATYLEGALRRAREALS